MLYDDKGMFPAKLMDDTPIQVFIDNGATPSILLISTYNKHPVLQKYPRLRAPHLSIQEAVQSSLILDKITPQIGKPSHPNKSFSL